jgi:hypothetical protein
MDVLDGFLNGLRRGEVAALAALLDSLRESGREAEAVEALKRAAEAVAAAVGRPVKRIVRPKCPKCDRSDEVFSAGIQVETDPEVGDVAQEDFSCGRCGDRSQPFATVEYRPYRWWRHQGGDGDPTFLDLDGAVG